MPELEKAEKNEQELLFMDAVHFIFATFMGYLCCISRIFLKSHAGRKRYNVLGALNSRTKIVSVFTNDTKLDGRSVCLFLKIFYNEYRGKRIIIVLDNARYQRCRLVTRYAKLLHIELLFLLSYSPNLNLIERFWKYVKKKAIYSKFHKDYECFKANIDDCVANAHIRDKEKLESLLTTNFEFFKATQCLGHF